MKELFLSSSEAVNSDETFILRFESWEGPIEALLDLAKSQKVDLARIDILDLALQFESVVDKALSLRIDLAADWLVMASWIAYLKSRLLLKRPKDRDGPQDEDALAFHLRRLDAVKTASEKLPERLILGRDWFAPSGVFPSGSPGISLTQDFLSFLSSYPKPVRAEDLEHSSVPHLKPFDLASVDAALDYLRDKLPIEWADILRLVPHAQGLRLRSNVASTFIATLEMARDGKAEMRQSASGDPVEVRRTK